MGFRDGQHRYRGSSGRHQAARRDREPHRRCGRGQPRPRRDRSNGSRPIGARCTRRRSTRASATCCASRAIRTAPAPASSCCRMSTPCTRSARWPASADPAGRRQALRTRRVRHEGRRRARHRRLPRALPRKGPARQLPVTFLFTPDEEIGTSARARTSRPPRRPRATCWSRSPSAAAVASSPRARGSAATRSRHAGGPRTPASSTRRAAAPFVRSPGPFSRSKASPTMIAASPPMSASSAAAPASTSCPSIAGSIPMSASSISKRRRRWIDASAR